MTEQASEPAVDYTRVDAAEFGDGQFNMTSPDGSVECQFNHQHSYGRVGPMSGGCVGGGVEGLVWLSNVRDHFLLEQRDSGYPGHMAAGKALEVGGVVPMGTIHCFSSAADAIGCMDMYSGEGFDIRGDEVLLFDQADHQQVLGGAIIGEYFHMSFDNGGSIYCTGSLTCGNAIDLNFPDDDNIVSFDLEGPTPAVERTGSGDIGLATSLAQRIEPGNYHYGDLSLAHDGQRATFTTPEGETFWVGIDGFGVE